LIMGAV